MKFSKIVESKARKMADKFMATDEYRAAIFEWIYTHCQNQKVDGFHAGPASTFGNNVFIIMIGKVSTTTPGVEIAASEKTITLVANKANTTLRVPELIERGNGNVTLKLALYQLSSPTAADRKRLPVRKLIERKADDGKPSKDETPTSM